MKLFCAGAGVDTPDITNASRQMKKSEMEACEKNGVTEVVEVKGLIARHLQFTGSKRAEQILNASGQPPAPGST